MGKRPTSEWKSVVIPALVSKINELKLIGYARVTPDELWECLEDRVWQGNPEKYLHEVVQDIIHLPPSVYISYITVAALTVKDDKADLLASIRALTNPEL